MPFSVSSIAFENARNGDVSLLMADTEAAAAALSARARDDLVARGLVEPTGAVLADGNQAGEARLPPTPLFLNS